MVYLGALATLRGSQLLLGRGRGAEITVQTEGTIVSERKELLKTKITFLQNEDNSFSRRAAMGIGVGGVWHAAHGHGGSAGYYLTG